VQTPNSDKNWQTSCPLQTFVCNNSTFGVYCRAGSPGQLGLWVAGSQNVTQFHIWHRPARRRPQPPISRHHWDRANPHNETQSPLDRRWLPASTMMSKIINRLRPPTQRDASGALMENEQVVGAVKRPVGRKSSVAKYYYYHYYLLCNSHSQKTSAYI